MAVATQPSRRSMSQCVWTFIRSNAPHRLRSTHRHSHPVMTQLRRKRPGWSAWLGSFALFIQLVVQPAVRCLHFTAVKSKHHVERTVITKCSLWEWSGHIANNLPFWIVPQRSHSIADCWLQSAKNTVTSAILISRDLVPRYTGWWYREYGPSLQITAHWAARAGLQPAACAARPGPGHGAHCSLVATS